MTMDGVLRLYFGESNLPTPRVHRRRRRPRAPDGHTFYSENAGLPALRRGDRRASTGGCTTSSSTREREIVVTAVRASRRSISRSVRRSIPGTRRSSSRRHGRTRRRSSRSPTAIPVEVPLALDGERYGSTSRARGCDRPTDAADRAHLALESARVGRRPPTSSVRLLDLCRERGIWLVADEVYERIYYGGAIRRPGALDPAAVRPRRPRPCRAVVLEELLHDRLARRLARHATRTSGRSSPS